MFLLLWSASFEDPIPLPDGRWLLTLRDVASYVTKLPKAEHSVPEWQAAMEALILVAESDGPTMLARIGVMRALILQLQRAGIPTASAELLLQRMLAKIDGLCADRDRLKKEMDGPTKGRVLGGRRW